MKENKVYKKKAGFRVGLIVALVVGMMFSYMTLPQPTIVHDERGWHVVWEGSFAQAAEADPGAAAGGILEIFFINHSASPDTTYTVNTSATLETWCTAAGLGYASADDFNFELAHSVDFDVVIRVRGNQTQCYRTDHWHPQDLRVRWTSSDLSVSADTVMTGVVSYNNSAQPYLWMNFYDDNSGSGFSLSKDQSVDITSIKFEAYY